MSTHTYTLTRPLTNSTPETRAHAISLLHNHGNVITLSPLVVSYTVSPPSRVSQPALRPTPKSTTYTITDAVAYLPFGLYTGHVSVTAEFTDTEDGVTTIRQAPLGFVIRERWALQEACGNDGVGFNELILEVELSANAWVLPLFKGMMEANHAGYIEGMLKLILEDGNASKTPGLANNINSDQKHQTREQ